MKGVQFQHLHLNYIKYLILEKAYLKSEKCFKN